MKAFGPFLLLEKIGEGGAGVVHLAVRREDDERPVVVKMLHERFANEPTLAARLRHEGAVAVSIDSPHVVRVEEVGSVAGLPFIAMERVAGCTVGRMLALLVKAEANLPLATAAGLIDDGLAALEALHAAVHPVTREPLDAVHRDVSPRNLMITPEGRLVLIDLGLGKSNLRDWATKTGAMMGTPGYLAPEQIAGDKVDHRADLYALAVVAFELLTTHYYVARQEPAQMLGAALAGAYRPASSLRGSIIPPALDRWLERALSQRPEDRHSSAAEMRAELVEAVGIEIAAADPSAFPPAYHREIAEAEARTSALLRESRGEQPPEPPTVIYARRRPATATALLAPPRSFGRTLARAVWGLALVVALAAGVMVGLRIDERQGVEPAPLIERAPIATKEHPPEVTISVSPKAAPASEVIAPPETSPPPPQPPRVVSPVVSRVRRAPTPREAVPPPRPPSPPLSRPPDFEALARRAAALKAKRPQLGAQLDALIMDATMWRRAEASAASHAARARLEAQLEELEARR